MRTATLTTGLDGTRCLHITIGTGHTTDRQFASEAELSEFLQAGKWDRLSSTVWTQQLTPAEPWVAFPYGLGSWVVASRGNSVKFARPLCAQVLIEVVSISPLLAGFPTFAFKYTSLSKNFAGWLDPVLPLISPPLIQIGSVGAWISAEQAEVAAQVYVSMLEEVLGHEYFDALVDSVLLGHLDFRESRHKLGLAIMLSAQSG
jgi:hypothetical protein